MKYRIKILFCVSLMAATLILQDVTGSALAAGALNTFNNALPVCQVTKDLMPHGLSRPGTKLVGGAPKYIVLHYTANPTGSASDIADFFGLSNSGKLRKYQDSTGDITYAETSPGSGWTDIGKCIISSNYVIGQKGEILQLIPDNEMAYHAGNSYYNKRSVSIEVCNMDDAGDYTQAAYTSMVRLVTALANKYNIPAKNIIRHYDVNGKWCPALFAGDNNAAWSKFKQQVASVRANSFKRTLKLKKPYMTGSDVKNLQTKLLSLGVFSGKADGVFGSKTKAAVVSFQKKKRLAADGIVGRKTWNALFGLIN